MTKWDKILTGLVLVFSISGMIFTTLSVGNGGQRYAIVSVDGKVIKKISMDDSKELKTYEFQFNHHKGYIEMKDGSIRMLEMSKTICPDAICSETGWIHKKYQSIVCLPNKIIVNFEDNQEADIDVISF